MDGKGSVFTRSPIIALVNQHEERAWIPKLFLYINSNSNYICNVYKLPAASFPFKLIGFIKG